MVPITVTEWNEPKKANIGAKYLEERIKETLWDSMMSKFNLPADLPQKMKDKVKEWTLSKMARNSTTGRTHCGKNMGTKI